MIITMNHDYELHKKLDYEKVKKQSSELLESMKKSFDLIKSSEGCLKILSTYRNIHSFVGVEMIKHISSPELIKMLNAKVKKLAILFDEDSQLKMNAKNFERRLNREKSGCKCRIGTNEQDLMSWLEEEDV